MYLQKFYCSPMTYTEFFKELVSTRLALGFQVILSGKSENRESENAPGNSSKLKRSRTMPKKVSRNIITTLKIIGLAVQMSTVHKHIYNYVFTL